MNETNEIKITVSKISENDRSAFIQHLKNSIQDYDPQLQIDISEAEPFFWLTTRKGYFKLYYSKCRFIETDRRSLIFHCESSILLHSGEKLPLSRSHYQDCLKALNILKES